MAMGRRRDAHTWRPLNRKKAATLLLQPNMKALATDTRSPNCHTPNLPLPNRRHSQLAPGEQRRAARGKTAKMRPALL
jgi:hypothetical protein